MQKIGLIFIRQIYDAWLGFWVVGLIYLLAELVGIYQEKEWWELGIVCYVAGSVAHWVYDNLIDTDRMKKMLEAKKLSYSPSERKGYVDYISDEYVKGYNQALRNAVRVIENRGSQEE